MDKVKAKNVLHWILFVSAIAGAFYVAFIAKGLGIVERIGLAGSTLGGLFVALAKLFPVLDKAVDALPDDAPKPDIGPGPKAAAVLILAGGLMLSGAARADQPSNPLSDIPLPVIALGNWTCQPVVGTGVQFNLNTDVIQRGVSFNGGVGCTYRGHSVPLGVAAFGGASLSENTPNVPQGTLLLTAYDYLGIGFAAQRLKDSVTGEHFYQGLLTAALLYNVGASATAVVLKAKATREARQRSPMREEEF